MRRDFIFALFLCRQEDPDHTPKQLGGVLCAFAITVQAVKKGDCHRLCVSGKPKFVKNSFTGYYN